MNTSDKQRVELDIVPSSAAASAIERVVIVIGAAPECAESVAQGFATQGEPVEVMWFEKACQAVAAGLHQALAGVIVCHSAERSPASELSELRRALPHTPVLPWQVA